MMDYFLLIIVFLLLPILNHAQNNDSTTSITQTSWFWPLLSICLALLLSIPCTLLTIMIFCYKKKHAVDSDESSTSSNSLSSSSSSSSAASSTRTQRRPIRHHSRHHHHHHPSRPQPSHYAGGFRSPPPPYTTSERPENAFITASLPPPYECHITENDSRTIIVNPATTIINVEPAESTINQSINNPRHGTTLDASSTLTNPSIQTFQV